MNTNQTDKNTVAVFDIGSNAVRLTVYRTAAQQGIETLIKQVELCEMGRAHSKPGYLYPQGADRAIKAIDRYCQTIRAPQTKCDGVVAVATEAIRSAQDGPDFIRNIQQKFGLNVRILNEEDEGKFGARGVLYENPQANGIVADLGGGSMQLTRVQNGEIHDTCSMPLGTLKMIAHTDSIDGYIDQQFGKILPSLAAADNLYIIGGSWRSLAKLYTTRAGGDPRDVDGMSLDPDKIRSLTGWLHASPAPDIHRQLTQDYHLEKSRAEGLPFAAHLLVRLIDRLDAQNLTVSSAGVRDGILQSVISGAITPDPVPMPPQGARPSRPSYKTIQP